MVQSPDVKTLEKCGFWPHPSRDKFYKKEAPWKKKYNLHGYDLKKNCFFNFKFCPKMYDVGEEEFYSPTIQDIPLHNKFDVLDNEVGVNEDTQPIHQGYSHKSPNCLSNIKYSDCIKYNKYKYCNNCKPDYVVNCNKYKKEELRLNKYFSSGYPPRFINKPKYDSIFDDNISNNNHPKFNIEPILHSENKTNIGIPIINTLISTQKLFSTQRINPILT